MRRNAFAILAALASALGADFGSTPTPNTRHRHSMETRHLRGPRLKTGKSRAYRKRKREWEATRRELARKGENLGSQALHNERRRGKGHWREFSVVAGSAVLRQVV